MSEPRNISAADFEASISRLITFDGENLPPNTEPFSEQFFDNVRTLLEGVGKAQWSKRPRTYTVLRLIDRVDTMDKFVVEGLLDVHFPYQDSQLPKALDLSESSRARFIDTQRLVLSDVQSLELGTNHVHLNSNADNCFTIIKQLGKGGFGVVDHVKSKLSLEQYARKRIMRANQFSRDKAKIRLFINELSHLKRLQHRHLVRLVGSYTDPRYLGLLLDPIADCDLKHFLNRGALLPKDMTLLRHSFGCLASAIQYLHGNQCRHKDLKPANILVKGDRFLITDFGTARDWSDRSRATTTGPVDPYTAAYAAPEVVAQDSRGNAADIWSLGCIFLEIVTILKGETLESRKNFFETVGNGLTHIHANSEALPPWIAKLRSNGKDSLPLQWVEIMIIAAPRERTTATELFDQILACYDDENYYGDCCGPQYTDGSDGGQHPDSEAETSSCLQSENENSISTSSESLPRPDSETVFKGTHSSPSYVSPPIQKDVGARTFVPNPGRDIDVKRGRSPLPLLESSPGTIHLEVPSKSAIAGSTKPAAQSIWQLFSFPPPNPTRKDGVTCNNCLSANIPPERSAKLQCQHYICHACLKHLFELSTFHSQLMPPKCCMVKIPLKCVDKLLASSFKRLWNRKFEEFSTKNPLYCPEKNCGNWIKPKYITHVVGSRRARGRCTVCHSKVCRSCGHIWDDKGRCCNDFYTKQGHSGGDELKEDVRKQQYPSNEQTLSETSYHSGNKDRRRTERSSGNNDYVESSSIEKHASVARMPRPYLASAEEKTLFQIGSSSKEPPLHHLEGTAAWDSDSDSDEDNWLTKQGRTWGNPRESYPFGTRGESGRDRLNARAGGNLESDLDRDRHKAPKRHTFESMVRGPAVVNFPEDDDDDIAPEDSASLIKGSPGAKPHKTKGDERKRLTNLFPFFGNRQWHELTKAHEERHKDKEVRESPEQQKREKKERLERERTEEKRLDQERLEHEEREKALEEAAKATKEAERRKTRDRKSSLDYSDRYRKPRSESIAQQQHVSIGRSPRDSSYNSGSEDGRKIERHEISHRRRDSPAPKEGSGLRNNAPRSATPGLLEALFLPRNTRPTTRRRTVND